MILVDSNVLMYASGAEHPNEAPSVAFLKRVAAGGVDATIDAEVLQEVTHRYRALRRWPEGRRVYDLARGLFPEVLALTGEVKDRARRLADSDRQDFRTGFGSRRAVVTEYKLEGICAFDRDFDRIQGCKRIRVR